MRIASGVANVRRKCESRVESRAWVANVSREWSREMGSRMGVVKWGHENKKFGGICNWDPEGSN